MVYKNKQFLAVLALAIVCLYPVARIFQKHANSLLQEQTEQRLDQRLDEIHQTILSDIQKEFDIPQDEWTHAMDQCKQLCQNDDLTSACTQNQIKSSDPVVTQIQSILIDSGINPNKVTINFIKNTNCPLQVRQVENGDKIVHYIDVNRTWFTKHDPHIKRAVVSHEVEHLKHYDSIESGFILEVLDRNGYNFNDYQKSKACRAYRHAREFRADLLAGSRDINIAQALQEDLTKRANSNIHEDLSSHPSSKARVDYLTQLISQMNKQPVQLA